MNLMTRFVVALALVMIAMLGMSLVAQAQQDDPNANCPSEQVLVKVQPGPDPAEVVGRHGGTILSTIKGIDVQVVAVPAGTRDQKLEEFNADPDVRYAEANGEVRATEQAANPSCTPPSANT